MEEERGGVGGGEEVVELEDAVKLLVEHLVTPVLPRGAFRREEALSPENQDIVARQIHATVILYNYYHRKQYPQLEFADPERFCMCASFTAGEALLMYLQQVHDHHNNGAGTGGGLSVTDKAVVDACDIARALDATKDSPEITMWPITKVAVLLLDRAKKMCLLEHGSETKGVLSFLEKDIKSGSHASDLSVQESSNKSMALPSELYMLQQIAYQEVELKTGIKRPNLRFLEEHRVYSLSEKGTATMLFVLQYEQTGNGKLMERPLEFLVQRMSGPIFRSHPDLETTSVVECYHLLPYKEVLLSILNRAWPLDSSHNTQKGRVFQNGNPSSHSEIDESLKDQEANSKSKMKRMATTVSTPKKNKQIVKAVSDSGTNKNKKNSSTNSKRKSETFRATLTTPEHGDGESPTKETDSLAVTGVGSSKLVRVKATKSTNVESIDLQARIQMDKDATEKHFKSRNMPQDIVPVKALDVDPGIKNHTLESQKEKVVEKSGVTTGNMNVQMYATLQLLQKMRDDTLREHCMLGDRSAQYEMEIQTILTEGEMTPKVMSILKKYESRWNMMEAANPTCSGDGCQTMNIKRKKLKEAVLLRSKIQELDDICRDSNWILPRYKVLPSVTGDLYQASVYLTGPDFNLSADGDSKITPHEARDSAASNMLYQLHQKAEEN